MLESRYGLRWDILTHNSWRRWYRKTNLRDCLKRWYPHSIGNSTRSSWNAYRNVYQCTNLGITQLSFYQEHQNHFGPKSILCHLWNKRSWIALLRKTCGKDTFVPLSHLWRHPYSLLRRRMGNFTSSKIIDASTSLR